MSSWQGVIMGLHAGLALLRQEPHWMINEAEAQRYSVAVANAMRHFPVQTSQKAIDLSALVFAFFQFEGPRVARSAQLRREAQQRAREAAQQGPGATVYQLHPHNNAAGAPPNGTARGPAQPTTTQPIADPPDDQPEGFGPH